MGIPSLLLLLMTISMVALINVMMMSYLIGWDRVRFFNPRLHKIVTAHIIQWWLVVSSATRSDDLFAFPAHSPTCSTSGDRHKIWSLEAATGHWSSSFVRQLQHHRLLIQLLTSLKSECPYLVSRAKLYVVSNCWRPIVIQILSATTIPGQPCPLNFIDHKNTDWHSWDGHLTL